LDKECQIILEDIKRAYNKMINGNTRQNEREYKDKRKEADKIFKKGGRVLFKSKLEQMDIAYNKMKAKNFIKK
jgi:3-oxoacyl-[acyl-carrier-protein] synthase III